MLGDLQVQRLGAEGAQDQFTALVVRDKGDPCRQSKGENCGDGERRPRWREGIQVNIIHGKPDGEKEQEK